MVPSTAPAQRAGRCLLLGDITTTVPVPDGRLAVVLLSSLELYSS